ncbi:phosphoribosyltransferase family protein [Lipingzhangella sp. LS1_29]|uniref:Phosphoribosyltransferase family protein n=1 Tax=Lipingzhangella rawalii TaxID=2055835 RepID=A0ABU2HBA4_9ACTN|nr:phosphoribosyltransferase family protein [Lipingzhangella rawalii]MDS1272617.1 phosphoribosyltransferase family protein [Lipingzhangella rawalii]
MSLPFVDRSDAGRRLAERVRPFAAADPIVLALPRGGVAVGAELARSLGVDLGVLLVRKLGLPGQPELGVGALAEDGQVTYDDAALARLGVSRDRLSATVRAEQRELRRRSRKYRGDRPVPRMHGRDVLVVDDGLATGASALAALRMVRRHHPSRLVLAVPVGSLTAVERLRSEADDVVLLCAPENFRSVGEWYQDFDQLTDEQVTALLTELDTSHRLPEQEQAERAVRIRAGDADLDADLILPPQARGTVVLAVLHGKRRERSRRLVSELVGRGYATLAVELLSSQEVIPRERSTTRAGVGTGNSADTGVERDRTEAVEPTVDPEVGPLAHRLQVAVRWLRRSAAPARNPVGLLGVGPSVAPVLVAASRCPADVAGVVVAGGRVDDAEGALTAVRAPTLALVEGADSVVYELTAWAVRRIDAYHELRRVAGAESLLTEPGQAGQEYEVAAAAGDWFERHL